MRVCQVGGWPVDWSQGGRRGPPYSVLHSRAGGTSDIPRPAGEVATRHVSRPLTPPEPLSSAIGRPGPCGDHSNPDNFYSLADAVLSAVCT